MNNTEMIIEFLMKLLVVTVLAGAFVGIYSSFGLYPFIAVIAACLITKD